MSIRYDTSFSLSSGVYLAPEENSREILPKLISRSVRNYFKYQISLLHKSSIDVPNIISHNAVGGVRLGTYWVAHVIIVITLTYFITKTLIVYLLKTSTSKYSNGKYLISRNAFNFVRNFGNYSAFTLHVSFY